MTSALPSSKPKRPVSVMVALILMVAVAAISEVPNLNTQLPAHPIVISNTGAVIYKYAIMPMTKSEILYLDFRQFHPILILIFVGLIIARFGWSRFPYAALIITSLTITASSVMHNAVTFCIDVVVVISALLLFTSTSNRWFKAHAA
jgi:hypothetical protein